MRTYVGAVPGEQVNVPATLECKAAMMRAMRRSLTRCMAISCWQQPAISIDLNINVYLRKRSEERRVSMSESHPPSALTGYNTLMLMMRSDIEIEK